MTKLSKDEFLIIMDRIIQKTTFLKEHMEQLNVIQWEETKDYCEFRVVIGAKE